MQIVNIINDLLNHLGYPDADIKAEENMGRVRVDIKLPEARELIGEKGATLAMFQHISRRIIAKQVSLPPIIDIDVNNYKQIREGVLRGFAQEIGERVRTGKRPVELDPMPSFDRRIIHLALAGLADITTESMGEGQDRYIVVRPYPVKDI